VKNEQGIENSERLKPKILGLKS